MEENVDKEKNFIIDVTCLSDNDVELFEAITTIQEYNRISNDDQRNKRKLKTNGRDETCDFEDDDLESNSDSEDDLCSNGFDSDQVYSEISNSDAHLEIRDEPSRLKGANQLGSQQDVRKKCKWFASVKKNNGDFQVKVLRKKHKCNPQWKVQRALTTFLTNRYKELITANPFIKLNYIQSVVKTELGININISKARKTKLNVLKEIEIDVIEEYATLYDYAEELRRSNRGSTIEIKTEMLASGFPPLFLRFYTCFDALRRGFLVGCRPLLGMDGCYLKGIAKGELLTVVARDANNQMFPLAWCVVKVESTTSWTWFLEILKRDIGTPDGCGHVWANWIGKGPNGFRGKCLQKAFWARVKATNVPCFEQMCIALEKEK
ncbi:hypothetical protein Gogos_021166 [Gossypium gossypioides]|uniref:MULE transposase domain-containing protein n=1 Tax=Gossypium gossypioides TaxID=34282 RepID=A0A7J9CXU8_GOSGO|nr:hypothetical protein [Gossypium gossypioides]